MDRRLTYTYLLLFQDRSNLIQDRSNLIQDRLI